MTTGEVFVSAAQQGLPVLGGFVLEHGWTHDAHPYRHAPRSPGATRLVVALYPTEVVNETDAVEPWKTCGGCSLPQR